MNLIGAKIKHKSFGVGEIVKFYENNGKKYIDVRFSDKVYPFVYSKNFLDFFEIDDEELRKDAEAALAKQLEADELERQREAEARELLRKKREEAEAQRRREIEEQRRFRAHSSGAHSGKHFRSETDKNIIFKCVLCDGGKSDSFVGFRGICSAEQRHYNLGYHKEGWCNQPNTLCRKCEDGIIVIDELEGAYKQNCESICYEANLLNSWQFAAGVNSKGRPRTIGRNVSDRLCILTTQFNNDRERYVLAVFLVEKYDRGNISKEGRVYAYPRYRISLTESEMYKMPLSKYYDTDWKQGLFRYTSDNVAKTILNDLIEIKHDPAEKQLLEEIYAEFCLKNNLEP